MRSLGTVAFPGAVSFESSSDVGRRCNEYAKAKALDDFKTSGKISTLDTLQTDIDTCSASLDRGRQIRQFLILTVGLSLAGYLGFLVWRNT